MIKDHCVLGGVAYNRTWSDEAGAIEYAKHLIAKPGSADKLFVVKIVKVIELPPLPTIVREPTEKDTLP